ncbi:MAG: regulatory protein RecX [Ruminococcaceae bacterium]|nr:regulatory protein RecX [Oscillospiraceae bacterium]
MRIEKIEKSKHKQERVLVFLEGGDLLRVTGQELLRFGLQTGMDLSPELVVQLQDEGRRSETKAAAARMAGSRMLSKKQVMEKLLRRGSEPEEAQELADWLEDLGAVDDAAYAAVLVRHYAAMGYGAGRIRQEFIHRGVPRQVWDEALEQLPDPSEAIETYIQKKAHGTDRKEMKRLADALLRRGFSWQEIRPVLSRWTDDLDEE